MSLALCRLSHKCRFKRGDLSVIALLSPLVSRASTLPLTMADQSSGSDGGWDDGWGGGRGWGGWGDGWDISKSSSWSSTQRSSSAAERTSFGAQRSSPAAVIADEPSGVRSSGKSHQGKHEEKGRRHRGKKSYSEEKDLERPGITGANLIHVAAYIPSEEVRKEREQERLEEEARLRLHQPTGPAGRGRPLPAW